MKSVIREAARRVGGIPALAGRIGVTRQAIYQWKVIPVDKIEAIARETGLPKSALRPDLFAPAPALGASPDYATDFAAWAEFQADAIRAGQFSLVDRQNVADEVEDMARSDKFEIEGRLAKLLSHLLKWKFQPDRRSPSWEATILEQRARIAKRIDRSPSLRSYPAKVLSEEYSLARREAAIETGLPLEHLPETCPFAIEDVLDLDFLPSASGHNETDR